MGTHSQRRLSEVFTVQQVHSDIKHTYVCSHMHTHTPFHNDRLYGSLYKMEHELFLGKAKRGAGPGWKMNLLSHYELFSPQRFCQEHAFLKLFKKYIHQNVTQHLSNSSTEKKAGHIQAKVLAGLWSRLWRTICQLADYGGLLSSFIYFFGFPSLHAFLHFLHTSTIFYLREMAT